MRGENSMVRSEDPLSAVAEGTGKALQELALLKRVTNTDR